MSYHYSTHSKTRIAYFLRHVNHDVQGIIILGVCEVARGPALQFAQALVHKGANLNAVDLNGWTPLHVAAAAGNYATASRLVELGADIYIYDSWGCSPLHVMGMDHHAARQFPQMDYLFHAIRIVTQKHLRQYTLPPGQGWPWKLKWSKTQLSAIHSGTTLLPW